jgi:hypothetical protein
MNRKLRRTAERNARRTAKGDVQARQARAQAAASEVQRLTAMLQQADTALRLASQIAVVEAEPDIAPEDDPNFFRTAAIEDFTDRLELTRTKLIGAHEEFYLALDGLDPADEPLLHSVPPVVTP